MVFSNIFTTKDVKVNTFLTKSIHVILSFIMKTKLFIVLWLLLLFNKGFSQPDSFSTTISDPNYGELDIVLYKYSVRSDNYQIFLYDGVNLTPYSIPEIRTYRGYVTNLENSKITAVWYPDNSLYIKLFSGKGEQYGFQINSINTNGLNITPLNLPINTEIKKSDRHLTSGYTTTYDWFVDTAGSDIENAIAIFENGANQFDLSIVRDLGTSMSVDLLVIPVENTDIFNPNNSNYPNLNVTQSWWKCYGGGGGAGRQNYCNNYKGGRTSLWRAGFGSMPHEFGHTLDLGHHHNQHDAMHSNQFYFGRDNAIRAMEHLSSNGNICLENDFPDYPDPIHPYTPEDYAIALENQSVMIDVLENDIDYNGDSISILEYDSTTYYGGTVQQSGQTLIYTPPLNFIGKDFFFYKAQSGNQQDFSYFWNSGKVSIDVRANSDLALYYPFEETTGSVVFNQTNSSTQNHGTVIHGTMENNSNSNGVIGNCIELNANQMIAMNDILDPLDQSTTISIWFNLNEIPNNRRLIFDSGSRGRLTLSGVSIAIEGNKIKFFAQHEGKDNTGADRYGNVNWQTNRWYHAVLVIDRNSQKLYGYLDGNEVGNSEYRQTLKSDGIIKGYPGIKGRISTGVGAQCKGKLWEETKDQIIGKIDELKIYTRALNAIEVADEHNNPTGYYNCPIGLFDENVRDASFEKNIIKIKDEKDKLLFDWFATDDRKGQVLWSGYNSLSPNAPHGDNWGSITGSTAIYQQIGTWESNKDYAISFIYGKRQDNANTDLEVSLWVGGNDYPEKNRHLSDIGAQKIDQKIIDADVLNGFETVPIELILSSNNANYDCTPIWIMFENKNANNQKVNLIDNIKIDYYDTLSTTDNETPNLIQIYPNPTQSTVTISCDIDQFSNVSLLDNLGRVIQTHNSSYNNLNVDLSSLSTGIYFIKLEYKNQIVTKKVLKI